MNAIDVVSLLEVVQERLHEAGDLVTGYDGQEMPAQQHGASTSVAKSRLDALKAMSKAGRSDANTIDAKRGFPSITSH
jgi:hypothetical protein